MPFELHGTNVCTCPAFTCEYIGKYRLDEILENRSNSGLCI